MPWALADAGAVKAMEYLRGDVHRSESTGPRRVTKFPWGGRDADSQAEVTGFAREFPIR